LNSTISRVGKLSGGIGQRSGVNLVVKTIVALLVYGVRYTYVSPLCHHEFLAISVILIPGFFPFDSRSFKQYASPKASFDRLEYKSPSRL
jgi:hypothetical protein